MEKYYLDLIINEVKNFKKLQRQFGYNDLEDLISHYIEEDVITSREELKNVLKTLKERADTLIERKTFDNWWINKEGCMAVE